MRTFEWHYLKIRVFSADLLDILTGYFLASPLKEVTEPFSWYTPWRDQEERSMVFVGTLGAIIIEKTLGNTSSKASSKSAPVITGMGRWELSIDDAASRAGIGIV